MTKKYASLFILVAISIIVSVAAVKAARISGMTGVSSITAQEIETPDKKNKEVPSAPTILPSKKSSWVKKLSKPKALTKRDLAKNPEAAAAGIPQRPKKAAQAVQNIEKSAPEKRFVTIDFDQVSINIFIKFISELTGKNFVVDKAVKGEVTIISPAKISVSDAYRVFESVLEVHGYTTVPSGNITKIIPALHARSKNIETRIRDNRVSTEDKIVTQLISLKYADPNKLKTLFAPLISKSSMIIAYPPSGMLIITDVLSNIKRLLKIIKAIDIEGIGEVISIVPLENANAEIIAKSISSIFQQQASSIKRKRLFLASPVAKIVPDQRTNSLIILASENDTSRIKQLIKLLDKETPRGTGDIHVYYLQNANAEDITKLLTSIPGKQSKSKKGRTPTVSKDVNIVADSATNSLVITADKHDYLVLEDVIKKLDIPRRMVYIEALIMEVSVTKNLQLGVSWYGGKEDIGSNNGKSIGAFGSSISAQGKFPDISSVPPIFNTGLSMGIMGESINIGGMSLPSIAAVIRAYQGDTDVHVLSTPQVMTTDNEEAEIHVGKNIPFLSRQDQTSSGNDYSNYDFKDVGVTLKITPQINQQRFVRLKLEQEVSSIYEQEVIGLPTTRKRTAKTTVIIKDGHTIVIGGLIDESLNKIDSQVPLLGKIPILGWLFKSRENNTSKTNLFIFLTPHIIENPIEAQKVYDSKKDEIDKIREKAIKLYKNK